MTPKLTPAQRRVIDNLKAGRHWFWKPRGKGFNPQKSSLLVLRSLGLVVHYVDTGWRLTEKGKSV